MGHSSEVRELNGDLLSTLTLGVLSTFFLRRLWVRSSPHPGSSEGNSLENLQTSSVLVLQREGWLSLSHIPTYRFCLILYSESRLMAHGRTS